jgi:hypothetical protein
MKTRSLIAASNIGVMFLLVVGIAAEAAELKVLSAIGMQLVMEDLGPKFERRGRPANPRSRGLRRRRPDRSGRARWS